MQDYYSLEKIAEAIDQLQRMYGASSPEGKCSDLHLARIIDNENPPHRLIYKWRTKQEFPEEKYLERIGHLLAGLTLEQTKKFFKKNNDHPQSVNSQ